MRSVQVHDEPVERARPGAGRAGLVGVSAALSRVLLCNAAGVHDASTAELAVTLTLAALSGVPAFVRAADAHTWVTTRRRALADRRVLLVGYGGVGAAVERRLAGFEVDLVRVASRARQDANGPVHGVEALPDLLPTADVVVLCLPLTDATRGLVDAAFLARMRDGAVLVNVGRGAVVDTSALVAELSTGRDHRRPRRDGPRAAAAGPPAVGRARPPADPARRRQQHGVPAQGAPPRRRAAAALRRRRAAARCRRGSLTASVDHRVPSGPERDTGAVRLRVGVVLWLLSWVPYGVILGLSHPWLEVRAAPAPAGLSGQRKKSRISGTSTSSGTPWP